MMTDVFLKLLNMSIAASWVVLAAVVFRALFRKAPRWISLVMWGTVALRLVIPFSVESPLSMIPTTESFGTAGAASAPGQMEAGALREALALVHRALAREAQEF